MENAGEDKQVMSGKFEWHTLDERSWEQMDAALPATADPGQAHWTSRLFSGRFAVILFALSLLIFLGTRQIVQRAQESNEQIEADVAAAQAFIQQAALDRDAERLDLVLSESDMQWRQMQRVMLRRNLLFDRGPLNLWLDEEAVQDGLLTNGFSFEPALGPDLTTAELKASYPYLVQTAEGALETVSLTHVSHFAYDGIQWRQVPPGEDFWGQTQRYEGQMVRVDYPTRDGEIGHQLAADLDDAFVALCRREAAVACVSNPTIQITLSADTESFMPLSRPVQGNRFWIFGERMAAGDGFEIALPTPTLVGVPQSAQDRQALFKGYAGWLLTAYLSRKHPDLSFDHIAGLMADLDLQLPPPAGYRLPERGTNGLPAVDRAAIACYDGDHVIDQKSYDFRQERWVKAGSCADCGRIEEPIREITSADGRFVLSSAAESEQIQIAHFDGEPIGEVHGATGPVWLDETTFAFIATGQARPTNWTSSEAAEGESVGIAELSDAEGQVQVQVKQLISQQALLRALPEERIIYALRLDSVLAQGPAAGSLLILASNGLHEQFLFRVDPATEQPEPVTNWVDNGSIFRSAEVTDNGRFLTVMRHNSRRSYLTLIDLDSGQREIMELTGRPGARYAWSADEAWLLVADERLLRLISPADKREVTVKHTHEGCTAVGWE